MDLRWDDALEHAISRDGRCQLLLLALSMQCSMEPYRFIDVFRKHLWCGCRSIVESATECSFTLCRNLASALLRLTTIASVSTAWQIPTAANADVTLLNKEAVGFDRFTTNLNNSQVQLQAS